MSSKKIYIIRHGQTDFNLQGIVQGSGVDSSLNETGKAQAQAFYEAFKNVSFDKVYTSTLRRTMETIKGFLDSGLPHQAEAGLNEISWGTNEGKKITPEEDAYYHWMIEQWQKGNTALRIEGGESPEDVVARQKPVIEKWNQAVDEKTILVCMHGRAIRILLCQLLNYPLKSMDMFEHSNLCLYLLENTGSMYIVKTYNDVDHLKNVKPVEKILVNK